MEDISPHISSSTLPSHLLPHLTLPSIFPIFSFIPPVFYASYIGPFLASRFLWALQFKHTYLKESKLASTYEREHVAFVFLDLVTSLRMVLIPYFFQSFTVL